LLISLLFLNTKTFSQTNSESEYSSLLDSVKTFYGDTCVIGVSSGLIKRLYNYQQYSPVKNYLSSYETIKDKIEDFRKAYIKTIYDEPALLLDLSRILDDPRQQNIVNVCGIYLGPDSVTSISLSYIILRSSPAKFYSKLYQVANFDKAFKDEITNFGNDWYKSMELNEKIVFPLK
jgi:hypothetical protein